MLYPTELRAQPNRPDQLQPMITLHGNNLLLRSDTSREKQAAKPVRVFEVVYGSLGQAFEQVECLKGTVCRTSARLRSRLAVEGVA